MNSFFSNFLTLTSATARLKPSILRIGWAGQEGNWGKCKSFTDITGQLSQRRKGTDIHNLGVLVWPRAGSVGITYGSSGGSNQRVGFPNIHFRDRVWVMMGLGLDTGARETRCRLKKEGRSRNCESRISVRSFMWTSDTLLEALLAPRDIRKSVGILLGFLLHPLFLFLVVTMSQGTTSIWRKAKMMNILHKEDWPHLKC